MADTLNPATNQNSGQTIPTMPRTLDEARGMARQRFRERLSNGEKIGDCACGDESGEQSLDPSNSSRVTGVRFLDSGRTYYFDPRDYSLEVGDWVVVETSRGKEAGRVILAPHQVRQNMLQGELKPVLRELSAEDVERMNKLKREAAQSVKIFGAKIRERNLPMKPISAEYNFDGSHLLFNFSSPDRVDFRELAKELSGQFRCRVELRQVGPRDEARLLGGVGRCGRTLCCSSWLPVYPEISMNMAKTQDLPLNPSKVSGVCGRLLCCLSYENDQYRQMKVAMPRLGQTLETPSGPGMVISMQILKDLITVRLAADNTDIVFTATDLGFRKPDSDTKSASPSAPSPAPAFAPTPTPDEGSKMAVVAAVDESGDDESDEPATPGDAQPRTGGRRRRRRGRGSRRRGDGSPGLQA
jgi:cell fate regulator YaaT (PSP1 superfamily)